MRNLISIAFFLSIMAQLCQPAFASEISILPDQNNSFLLSGEIQKGDAERLAKALMLVNSNSLGAVLSLDSPGGDVEESLHIASLVKALHLNIIVAGGGTCASACFFIFLAGDAHFAIWPDNGRMPKLGLGYIGLHRPYLKLDPTMRNGSIDAEARQHDVMQIIGAYLRNQDVPQRLIDLMMSRPSNDIYWMTEEDIKQLGQYSPGREELLISRCGYSRHLSADIWSECAYTAFPDLIQERLTNRERLREGWRPWLQQQKAEAERQRQQASPTGAAAKSVQTFRDCPECPEMVVIPAGKFMMGSRRMKLDALDSENMLYFALKLVDQDYESPLHRVNVKAFAMGKYEVTMGQFAAFINETGYDAGSDCYKGDGKAKGNWRDTGFPQKESQPVVCVDSNDFQAYAQWLSKKTGKRYRLPSEAEWEYAARAGSTTAYYWGNDIGQNNANCHGCGSQWDGKQTAPVGSFAPNTFGLYDMSGNVWELVEDRWHENYKGAPTNGSAWQGDGGVIRGGSWVNDPHLVRTAKREFSGGSGPRDYQTGFRLARMLP